MIEFNWREFKPTILFLVKFLGLYLLLNLLYGAYVTHWSPAPDPVTSWVSEQTASILRVMGYDARSFDRVEKSTTVILAGSKPILSVYEGCNGVNSAIVFLSFLLAFGPLNKAMMWFAPVGVLLIHLTNLIRIVLLFFVTIYLPDYMYFTHKYLFTAFIYLAVFAMWVWWVARLSKRKNG